MSVPTWLRSLIDTGERMPQRFKGVAVFSACTRCGAAVFTGLEDGGYGREVTCTAEPLSRQGEAWARSIGKRTYRLYGMSRGIWEICSRMTWDIFMSPCSSVLPSGNVIVVLIEHECYMVIPFTYLEESVN